MSDTAVQGALAEMAVRRSSRWRRSLIAVASVWMVFVLLNLLLSGRWWPWLLFSLTPPAAYLAGSGVLLLVSGFVRRFRSRASIAVSLISLMLAYPQSGMLLQALWYQAPQSGEDVRVVAWNTEYWDQGEDRRAFYSRLRELGADVYLLSEYLNYEGGQILPINDRPALDQAFPGYHVIVKGQLVTLSRLPVVDVPGTNDRDLLRVDADTPHGLRFSTYNLHVPAQLDPTSSPLSSTFYTTIRQRAHDRDHSYQALRTSAETDHSPGVIAGDLNTTAAMGDLHKAAGLGEDAAWAGRDLYPSSWNAHNPIQLWKPDWMFVRNGLSARSYRLLDPWGMSDHRVQVMDCLVRAQP